MGLGDLRLHAEHCNSCKDCTALCFVTDYKQALSNWAEIWEMLLSHSIWHTLYCIHTERSFLLHRAYLTDWTSHWQQVRFNRYTAAVTGSTRQEREANRIMLWFPQPFIPRDCVRREYPEECSQSPLRLPGCHHVSVWSQSLWCGCLFQQLTPCPSLKNVSCAVGLPQRLLLLARSPRRAGYKGCLTSHQTEVFWMRQLGPTNQYFHWNVVSWVCFQPCLVTEPSCAVRISSASPTNAPHPSWAYEGPEGTSLAGGAFLIMNSQVPVSRPAPPRRAGRTRFPACIQILTLGKWAAAVSEESNQSSLTVVFFWLSLPFFLSFKQKVS